jgi:hypothetical protein
MTLRDFSWFVRFDAEKSQDVIRDNPAFHTLSRLPGRLVALVLSRNRPGGANGSVFVMVVEHSKMCDQLFTAAKSKLKFKPDFSGDVVSQVVPSQVNKQFRTGWKIQFSGMATVVDLQER